jgi:hypothetical protein
MTAKRLVAAFLLLSAVPQSRPSASEAPVVYVAALPSDSRNAAAAAFARELRLALGRGGVPSLAGPEGATAPEAITNASNAAGAQVSVGIRFVQGNAPCVTVRAPAPTPIPEARPIAEQDLPAWVKQTTLAERARDSELLAKELRHLGKPCSAREHWTSAYFIKGASGVSVVLELSETQSVVEPAASAIVRFVGGRGRRTKG